MKPASPQRLLLVGLFLLVLLLTLPWWTETPSWVATAGFVVVLPVVAVPYAGTRRF